MKRLVHGLFCRAGAPEEPVTLFVAAATGRSRASDQRSRVVREAAGVEGGGGGGRHLRAVRKLRHQGAFLARSTVLCPRCLLGLMRTRPPLPCCVAVAVFGEFGAFRRGYRVRRFSVHSPPPWQERFGTDYDVASPVRLPLRQVHCSSQLAPLLSTTSISTYQL